jgi:hypothetical protein
MYVLVTDLFEKCELLVQMADTPQDIINATATHQWVLTVTSSHP